MGSLPFDVRDGKEEIKKTVSFPFRFLTPFPHRPSRRLRNSRARSKT